MINLIGINWGLPNGNYNSWAADEIVPRRVLEALDKGFANGWHYKYPPVQFYLLALLYSPILLLHQLNLVFRLIHIYPVILSWSVPDRMGDCWRSFTYAVEKYSAKNLPCLPL